MDIYDKYFINIKLNKDTVFVYTVRKAIQEVIRANFNLFRGQVVDLGCGEMPYRQYLLNNCKKITKYIGVDVNSSNYHQTVKPDLFWDGKKINLTSSGTDIVMATELFEHLANLPDVLKEIRRILKRGGVIFFTVPFIWPLHETPHDEYRYTPYSLTRHLTNAGFQKINIVPMGGVDTSLAQMLCIWAYNNIKISILIFPVILFLMKRDSNKVHKTYGENSMAIGFYGYAKK